MLVAPSFALSGALVIVLITWLAASWYLFDFAQGLLFGRPRPERRYQDLGTPEMASLIIVLTLLVALGVVPARFFASEPGAGPDRHRTIGTGEGASPGKEPVAAGSRLGG
jgi:NADH:ubiquinone oxidoreductase subunit 4 (subunit M)